MQFLINLLCKALVAFATNMAMALASERLIKWMFFSLADKIVKSTKTDHDDIFLAKVKELYDHYEGQQPSN